MHITCENTDGHAETEGQRQWCVVAPSFALQNCDIQALSTLIFPLLSVCHKLSTCSSDDSMCPPMTLKAPCCLGTTMCIDTT